MGISAYGCCVLVVSLAAVIAGCGSSDSPYRPFTNSEQRNHPFSFERFSSSGFSVLLTFDGTNGAHPQAPLNVHGGEFDGTTYDGGNTGCFHLGCGTVFSMTASGQESVLYTFKGGKDGWSPADGLVRVNGVLYGTTLVGGTYKKGTVFSLSATGEHKVLYDFKGPPDGAYPEAGLTLLHGVFYGTTSGGGDSQCFFNEAYGCGTVFSVTTTGKERVLYTFKGGKDGEAANAGLTVSNGVLYGVTTSGGIKNCVLYGGGGYGCGVLFSITRTGKEHAVYYFKGGKDGGTPYAGLAALNGTLYGTTQNGGVGSGQSGYWGYGTVFGVTTAGKGRVLHRFQGGTDGAYPVAALTVLNGVLYGTTSSSGIGFRCGSGCGTVFSVTNAGKERVVHNFKSVNDSDGSNPRAPLIALNGTLFGTTVYGGNLQCGTNHAGCGTVFALTP